MEPFMIITHFLTWFNRIWKWLRTPKILSSAGAIILVLSFIAYHDIITRKLNQGKYAVDFPESLFDGKDDTGYTLHIPELNLKNGVSSEKGGFYLQILKNGGLVRSIGIRYVVNTSSKQGEIHYDPQAQQEILTYDEEIEKFLHKFHQTGIRVEEIKVQKGGCSWKAKWILDEYNKGEISSAKFR